MRHIIYIFLGLWFAGCDVGTTDESDARSDEVVESTGTETAAAKVVIPEGSTITASDVEITDGDQKSTEEALKATLPEDVTAAYLVGSSTYIAINPEANASQQEVLTLSALLPLVDKNGLPIPDESIDSV